MEETGVPGKKAPTYLQVSDKLYHIVLYRVHQVWAGFEFTSLVKSYLYVQILIMIMMT